MQLVNYLENRISFAPKLLRLFGSADFVAFLGVLIYFVQAVGYAHTTISDLDEGAYLLKGWLFATGEYHPFDPGISTNKAPLAFLMPGYVQLLFGPGLRTGRYFAVFLGVLMLVGTWLAAKRLSNKWLAAGAIWVLALNSPIIKIYSMGVTQVMIAFMMAWMLAFLLGEERPWWQLLLSGILAGGMMMVRQNMMPVLPFLSLYALLQHRWKGFLWYIMPGFAMTGLIFYVYWPGIVQLWTWVPFINIPPEYVYQGGGVSIWTPEISASTRLLSAFQSMRVHFFVMYGSLLTLFFWKRFREWESSMKFLLVLTLSVLFCGLLFMHAMAAIGEDYCVFCFKNYIAFFNVAAVLLVVISVKSWNLNPPRLVQILLIGLTFVMFAGMGFSAFEDVGDFSLSLPAFRIRESQILPSLITWRDILIYGFELNLNSAKKVASTLFGMAIGLSILITTYWVWKRMWSSYARMSFGAFFSSIVLIVGSLSAPILGGGYTTRDCELDIIASSELIGEYLQDIIPAGSSVYWDGGLSAIPLVYLSGVTIYPAQINSAYSFMSGGDTDEVHRFGFWNEELKAEWMNTSDFIIVEEVRYPGWREFLTPSEFDEYPSTPVGTSCIEGTRLRIFKRK